MKKFEEKFKNYILEENVLLILFLVFSTLISFVLRFSLRKIMSGDMYCFLINWLDTINELGVWKSLGQSIGDYNISYLLLLCILSLIQKIVPISNITIIKLSSIAFDYLGAVFVGLIIYELLKESKNRKIFAVLGYFVTICLPTVILDSAVWGQCDFIYVSFMLISIYELLKDKITLSFIFLGISFAFKLQFIFVLPVYVFLYFKRNDISILHFLILPIVNIIFCLPAIIAGRSLASCLSIYYNQTQAYEQMTLNFPNLYSIIRISTHEFASFGLMITILILMIFFFYLLYKKYEIKSSDYIELVIISIGICTYFLPSIHERYAFAAIIFTIIYSFKNKDFISLILLELIFSRAYSSFIESSMTIGELEIYSFVYLGVMVSIVVRFLKKLNERDCIGE